MSEDIPADGLRGKPKRWTRSECDEYFMNIMLKTCCEVVESGMTLNQPMIDLHVMEGWHTRCVLVCVCNYNNYVIIPPNIIRYLDQCLNEKYPKPHPLQHPAELWKHTAFENPAEYKEWKANPAKLGKPTVNNPLGGMPQRYHDFAKKIWEKFKLVRREIANATSALWAKLVPRNQLGSGKSMDQVVEEIRRALFDQWSMEPTSKTSTLVYCKVSIESERYARAHSHRTLLFTHTLLFSYKYWAPTWWNTWRSIVTRCASSQLCPFAWRLCGLAEELDVPCVHGTLRHHCLRPSVDRAFCTDLQ